MDLDRGGSGNRWTVDGLMDRGRAQALQEGNRRPDEERCISTGLLLAARLNPIEPTSLSEAQALGLVRMSLFDAGPVSGMDEQTRQAVIERFLTGLERHLNDNTEHFDRWFFAQRDNLVHQIAKQKKHGGPIAREVVRQALLDLVFKSYGYVSDCLCLQMQDFLQALPEPLTPAERTLFEVFYFKQGYLGGLSLLLLKDRFTFLKGALLDILAAPGEPGPISVLLRLLSYYEEMSSVRRGVDRDLKRSSLRDEAPGRGSGQKPLDADTSCMSVSDLHERRRQTIDQLRADRGLRCHCANAGTWTASLARTDIDSSSRTIFVEFECTECKFVEILQVNRSELKMIGHSR